MIRFPYDPPVPSNSLSRSRVLFYLLRRLGHGALLLILEQGLLLALGGVLVAVLSARDEVVLDEEPGTREHDHGAETDEDGPAGEVQTRGGGGEILQPQVSVRQVRLPTAQSLLSSFSSTR